MDDDVFDDGDWEYYYNASEHDYFATHYEDDLLERSNQDAWEDMIADMHEYDDEEEDE